MLITGTETDIDGYYSFTELDSGVYDVVFSYTGYKDYKVTGVMTEIANSVQLNAEISSGITLLLYLSPGITRSLLDIDETTQGIIFDSDQISRIAH